MHNLGFLVHNSQKKRIIYWKEMHNSGSPVIRKNATYSQSSVVHPLVIFAVIIIVNCTCSFWILHSVFQKRRAFCMHMRQYDLLKCHRGIFCELFTFIYYQHLKALFWSWLRYIGSYIPQACSLRYWGISPLKVSLLYASLLPLRGQSFLS